MWQHTSNQAAACRYKELLNQREGSDRFVEGEAQTVEHLQKAKEVQCNTTSYASTEVQVRTCYQVLMPCMASDSDLVMAVKQRFTANQMGI